MKVCDYCEREIDDEDAIKHITYEIITWGRIPITIYYCEPCFIQKQVKERKME